MRNQTLSEKKLGAHGVLQKYIAFANSSDFVERNDDYSVSLRRLEEMNTSIIAELSNTEKGVKLRTRSCSGIMMKIRLELSSSDERKQMAKERLFLGQMNTFYEAGNINDSRCRMEGLG